MTTTMTIHSATQDHPDAPRPPWTCPTCSVEFKSFATWTRTDAEHYALYRANADRVTAFRANVPDETVPQDDVDYRPGHGSGSGHGSPEMASEKQVAFLIRLATERGLVDTPELRTAYSNLTKLQASKAIDAMMNTPKTSTTPDAPTTSTVRRNKFAGTCRTCRGPVAEMDGILSSENGRWTVRHDGPCPVVADAPAATRTPSDDSVADVPDGYYAIESSGQNDLVFYAVLHSDRYGISVKMVVGGHVDTFVRRTHVAGIVARIAEDVDAAAKRYADEIGNCYRCNRTLTDETSRALGIGPTCRAKP